MLAYLEKVLGTERMARLQAAKIGIGGLGGLGSNIAAHLVRSGVQSLVLADFDRVENSNLNRQFYFLDQVGRLKAEALAENLRRINPKIGLTLYTERITPENVVSIFYSCEFWLEAFDGARMKKMFVEEGLKHHKRVVSASGLAGWGHTDAIQTLKWSSGLVVVGDLISAVGPEVPPLSPRVGVGAAKEADVVLSWILEEELTLEEEETKEASQRKEVPIGKPVGENILAWRMLDANLNRTAEGLRVIEDVLRFNYEDAEECAKVRRLRHALRESWKDFSGQLLAGRETASDPGRKVSLRQEGLDEKKSWRDLLLANLKRAQEGLRVTEEVAHLLGEKVRAKDTENMRFDVYELEKSLVIRMTSGVKQEAKAVFRGERPHLPAGIYALTSEPHSLGRSNLEVAREILRSGVKILQYREKNKTFREMYAECLVLRRMTQEFGALLIINDYLELALAVQADGVHIGQDDLPLQVVRELAGPGLIIGVSTHSPDQARRAVEAGADYIGVGPLYATQTKENVCAPVGLEYLSYVATNLEIPFVAIGGIKEHNLGEVISQGASTVALVTEIVGSPNIKEKIGKLQEIIEDHSRRFSG